MRSISSVRQERRGTARRVHKKFERMPLTRFAVAYQGRCRVRFATVSIVIISTCHVSAETAACVHECMSRSFQGSAYDGNLNGAALSSLLPLAPFLSSAGHLLSDPSALGSLATPLLASAMQHQSAISSSMSTTSSTPSLLSVAGSSSPVVVPVTIGESALQQAVKAAALSHGSNNGSESVGGDAMH